MKCPICNKKVEDYFESSVKEPFTHYNPLAGLTIYGPFSAEKETICQTEKYLHFRFEDGEERLVKLGCSVVV